MNFKKVLVSREATGCKTKGLTRLKRHKQQQEKTTTTTTRKCGFTDKCMGAEEWSLSVSHLHGRVGEPNSFHMGSKKPGRAKLLRPAESYGFPDLLAYKINFRTATADKFM